MKIIKMTMKQRADQNAFALECFRSIGSTRSGAGPWDSVLDWRLATQTLQIHGLLPMFQSVPRLPAAVQQSVLEARLRAATYQSNTLESLSNIARELKATGIPYAVLKGTYLYELLYRDLFPREYGDIDLLVPAARVADAVSVLEKAGYTGEGMRADGHSVMPRWHFHAVLTSGKPGGLPIELHRSLVDRANLYRIKHAELFGRLTDYRVGQFGFTVLAIEDQFIYLCLHVAKHGTLNAIGLRNGFSPEWFCDPAAGNRLLWFLDIECLLQKHRHKMDWPAIVERLQRWNVADDVKCCLHVLRLLRPTSAALFALHQLGDVSAAAESRTGLLSSILRSRMGKVWLVRSMQALPALCIRPIRCVLIGRVLVPSATELLCYYEKTNLAWLPWLYLRHPFHMIHKILSQPALPAPTPQ